MRINTRFPVAIHILVYIGIHGSESTSESIAHSVNTNPVVVRRLNGKLKKAGLICIRNGVGGTELARSPEQITLRDVFEAVVEETDRLIFDTPQRPNPDCPIGGNILEAITQPLSDAQEGLERALARYTIRDVMDEIERKL